VFIFSRHFWLTVLGALTARPAAALAVGNMILYTNTLVPGPDNVYGDLVQPTYPGYAPQAFTLTGPYTAGTGPLWLRLSGLLWQMSDATTPTTVQGAALVDSANNIIAVGNFSRPYNLVLATDALVVAGELLFGVSGQVGTWYTEQA
jgi:hypothetical protein